MMDRVDTVAFPRILSLPRVWVGGAYLCLYVLLDWISFIQPFGAFGITPWNPSAGLSLVLILVFGERFLPLLFVAPLAADLIVRHAALSPLTEAGICLIVGSGYSLATLTLLRPGTAFRLSLSTMRDLLVLLFIGAIAAAAVAIGLVLLLASTGLLAWSDTLRAGLRYWVGDMIGIAVVAPFLLILLTRERILSLGWEVASQIAAIAAALFLVFAYPSGPQLQLFYVLFLPTIWIAVRSGMEGAVVGLAVTQVGLMLVIYVMAPRDLDVTAFQALMLVLALSGLATGMLVTERKRAELQLRLHQEAQARISRLGSMGELAATIAHEINQPLMAAGTYTRLVVKSLASNASDHGSANDAAIKAAHQVERAAEVVRSLRALVRLGRSEAAPAAASALIENVVELMRPELTRWHITLRQEIPPDLPKVLADSLQIEQVLINIFRNAIEAIAATESQRGAILVRARLRPDDLVEIAVRDSGPGLSTSQIESIAVPFKSTKPEGLGVGLALSRSIIEAHGGRLWAEAVDQGASVHFCLPVAETMTP